MRTTTNCFRLTSPGALHVDYKRPANLLDPITLMRWRERCWPDSLTQLHGIYMVGYFLWCMPGCTKYENASLPVKKNTRTYERSLHPPGENSKNTYCVLLPLNFFLRVGYLFAHVLQCLKFFYIMIFLQVISLNSVAWEPILIARLRNLNSYRIAWNSFCHLTRILCYGASGSTSKVQVRTALQLLPPTSMTP